MITVNEVCSKESANEEGEVSQEPEIGVQGRSMNNSFGMTLVFFSVVCFSVGNTLVSVIGVRIPVLQITFFRGSSQLILALICIAVKSGPKRKLVATWLGAPENRIKLLSRGLWGVGALITWFASLQVLVVSMKYSAALIAFLFSEVKANASRRRNRHKLPQHPLYCCARALRSA